MTDARLIHDVADRTARRAVRLFAWDDDEQLLSAYRALLAVIQEGFETYRDRKARELRRLCRPPEDGE